MGSQKNSRKWLRRAIRLFLGWLIIHVIYITIDGLTDYKGNADVAVVLGNRVKADTSLSSALQGRVDKALLLYRQGRVKMIMVSGGMSKTTTKVPEGLAMKRYLIGKGVPADKIIEDNDGENTYLTAKDYIPVRDSLHLSTVIVVSSYYHITRTKYIFRKLGIDHVHGASSDVFFANDIIGSLREFPALYKYMLWY